MSEKVNKTPDLKVAIISDPHLGFIGHINPNYYGLGQQGDQDKWWEYALRWFKNRGVDVVVVPGDMANACAYSRTDVTHTDCTVEEMARLGKIFRLFYRLFIQIFISATTRIRIVFLWLVTLRN